MNASLLAALRVVKPHVAALVIGLLLLPMTAYSETRGVSELQKADLLTPQDFLEYASINDEDIHDLYFSVILYEGTESCLMCHQKEGLAALEMGHFKWKGKTDRMSGQPTSAVC